MCPLWRLSRPDSTHARGPRRPYGSRGPLPPFPRVPLVPRVPPSNACPRRIGSRLALCATRPRRKSPDPGGAAPLLQQAAEGGEQCPTDQRGPTVEFLAFVLQSDRVLVPRPHRLRVVPGHVA